MSEKFAHVIGAKRTSNSPWTHSQQTCHGDVAALFLHLTPFIKSIPVTNPLTQHIPRNTKMGFLHMGRCVTSARKYYKYKEISQLCFHNRNI